MQASVAACETGAPSKPSYLLPWTIDATFFCSSFHKFQDNTIVSPGGVASHGKNRSREVAEEMADGWAGIMQRFYDMPVMTAAFLSDVRRPVGVDDTAIIALCSTDDVSAALKRL